MVGEDKTFISLLCAANGVGKTAGGANLLAHILWGQSGNKWFDDKEFLWVDQRDKSIHRRQAQKLPLFEHWPYPKQGRIVSDPTTISQTLIPELKKWFPKGRYQTSKSGKNYEYNWKTDTGHKFEVMTYDQSTKEFESATLGWTWFDEPPPLAIFKATVARMRKGGIIFITATPLTGSAWMYDHIINYKGDKQGQRDYIHADIESNCIKHGIRGILKHRDIERMIAEYDEEDMQARVHGKFHHLIGLIFKEFDRKIHIIRPFKITKQDYMVIEGFDPHPRVPDALMWLAINRKGLKFVVDELYATMRTSELTEKIHKKEERYRIELRLIDPNAFNEDKHDEDPHYQTFAAELANDYDLLYEPATKNRKRADRRIKDALDYQMVGKEMIMAPELYIFNTCKRTIWELEHYKWAEWYGKAGERKDPKEVPEDKDDHMIENLGRLLVQEMEFIEMSVDLGFSSSRSGGGSGGVVRDPYA